MTNEVRAGVEKAIGPIQSLTPAGGGCIAHASRVNTRDGEFFLKWGGKDVVMTFEAEADGLRVLRLASTSFRVPEVVACDAQQGFLILEWVEKKPGNTKQEMLFGRALTEMHRYEGRAYGFEEDNFIGRSHQVNTWHDDWVDFFRVCRLEPQVVLARKNGQWQGKWTPWLERLYARLSDLLPGNPTPSVLHGDLWGGNYFFDVAGKAVLFDPAVYYGHRETDLAMTKLFGGFGKQFYDGYQEAWPMEPGFEERAELYNLYHLLNHLNLFGDGYAGGVSRVLQRFGR